MGYISKRETQYINNLINIGRESEILDFKEEWYKLEHISQKYEFVKDCLSFLNVSIDVDKYIIIGVKENKESCTFTKVGVCARPEENNIQEIINVNIEPMPQIDVFTKIEIEDMEIDIIKIRKENKDQPYLFRKDFNEKAKNDHMSGKMIGGFNKVCRGLGYIRHGSSSHLISRNELTNMFFKKQSNIYGFFNINSDINNEYFGEIMSFLDCMNSLISKESLDSITANNVFIKPKLFSVFNELIKKGNLFNDKLNRDDINDYICKTIIDSKDDFLKLKIILDGGENSIIILIFCATYCWFKLCNNSMVNCEIANEVAIIQLGDNVTDDEYKKIDKYLMNLNGIINELEKISFYYNRSENIFKIKSAMYDPNSSRTYMLSDVKFRVSEEIIPLLIEPLYKQSNRIEIALREMLQNSVDACKLIRASEYIGRIKISLRIEELKSILIFEDNGIGMNLDDIKNYYLTVGKSNKKESDVPVVGQFGIGALAMFLIGDRVQVRTKKSDDNEFRFELFESEQKVSNLSQKILSGKESYTIIEIELKNQINSRMLQEVTSELGIDKWIVNKNNLNVTVYFNDEEYIVPNISEKKELFKEVIKTERLTVLMYNKKIESENVSDSDFKKLEKIVKAKNLALYNDIIINVAYRFGRYRNLNTTNIPFVVIEGKTTDDEVSVELSRKTADVGAIIADEIAENIYHSEIEKIIDYLKENQGKSNSIKMKNEITQLVSEYIKLPLLLLRKNEIIIANSKLSTQYNNNTIVIHASSLNEKCIIFNENTNFIIKSFYSDKSSIADAIINEDVLLITSRYLHKYIINANSSSNGFRMEALKSILKNLITDINWELSYAELWVKVSQMKEHLIKAIEKKSVYGIYCFKSSAESIIKSHFSEEIENRDLLIYVKDINEMCTQYTYDSKFDEILLRSYSDFLTL